jgi:dihydroxy-acid dehydratase
MVRISDARMSGTAFGTVILHVAPEAAVGGPLNLVQDGDTISLDLENRRLDLRIDDAEFQRRLAVYAAKPKPANGTGRGYPRLYLDSVMQADEGADFDFLTGNADDIATGGLV